MTLYKHLVYNPHMEKLDTVIQSVGKEWCFLRSQPVTEYEWVIIFEKWEDEISGVEIKQS